MNLLLDTHAFLWWITDSPRLSDKARDAMADANNTLLWSVASSWEVAIKVALGRLELPAPAALFIPEHLAKNGIDSLPIHNAHAWLAGELPPLHKDPFDRMLVAQAQVEKLPIISTDVRIADYDVEVVW